MRHRPNSMLILGTVAVLLTACTTTPTDKTSATSLSQSNNAVHLFSPVVDRLTVSINGAAKAKLNGPLHWEWGDGTTSASWFPASHTYAKLGRFEIVVRDGRDGILLAQLSALHVTGAVLATEDLQNIHRLQLFSPQIKDESVSLNGVVVAPVSRIQWNWGDGTVDTHNWFPASHTYEAPGEYVVQVTTVDTQERISTKAVRVSIQ